MAREDDFEEGPLLAGQPTTEQFEALAQLAKLPQYKWVLEQTTIIDDLRSYARELNIEGYRLGGALMIRAAGDIAVLTEALRGLVSEAKAITGLAELELRQAVGNSNVAALLSRIETADALLAERTRREGT